MMLHKKDYFTPMNLGKYALLLAGLALLIGCGSSQDGGKELRSVSISPTSATLKVGSFEAFTATATYTDNSISAIIPTWSISTNLGTIIKVGYTGLFLASAEGTGSATATYGGKSASAAITVRGSILNTLTTIEVSPATVNELMKTTTTFTATGKNASNESVAFSPAWLISGDAIGVFTSSGTTATLEATLEGEVIISCVSYEVVGYSYVTIEGTSIDISVEANTYVDEDNPSVTYEGEAVDKAGYLATNPGVHYEAYFKFPLSDIPSGSTIEAATLRLYPVTSATPSFQFYSLSGAFNSATCWSNKPSCGTYIFSKTFTAEQYNSFSGTELLDLVRAWYASPSTNYGIALRQDGADNGVVAIASKKNETKKPFLTIEYKSLDE